MHLYTLEIGTSLASMVLDDRAKSNDNNIFMESLENA